MKVCSEMSEGRLRVKLCGELDHHGAKHAMLEIEELIDVFLPRDLIIDMEKLLFMDSSGIAVVLRSSRRMNEIGGRLWIENVPQQPMRVLDASGIERIVQITAMT